MIKRRDIPAFPLIIYTFAMVSGCTPSRQEIAQDEAQRRAVAENKPIATAAKEWFYPKVVQDYFPGMDAVATPAPQQPQDIRELPDQLLDTVNKEFLKPGSSRGPKRAATVVRSPDFDRTHLLGRNTWMMWCGGNEAFWDWLATKNIGFIDLLKVVDSRQRNTRFRDAGTINEPGMEKATGPDRFGLWLDVPQDARLLRWREAYLQRTFEQIAQGQHKSQRGLPVGRQTATPAADIHRGNKGSGTTQQPHHDDLYLGLVTTSQNRTGPDEPKMPESVQAESGPDHEYYATKIPPPDIYGLSSGIIGLRLFPNPNFDQKAAERWNGQRYLSDPGYFQDPDLVRPYRVGMSCAFCHASFHPLKPPKDITRPEWENISGNIGAQYLSMRATVGNLLTPDLFAFHLLESQPRGTIDTSLIASDNINNPNTMNAIFRLPQRGMVAFSNPQEVQAGTQTRLPSFWPFLDPASGQHPDGLGEADPLARSALASFRKWGGEYAKLGLGEELQKSNDNPRHVPRVLLDGADSIGVYGALARVYLNIGMYSERWNQLHQPVLGLTPQRPFSILDCEQHSVYWHATKLRVGALRDYFLEATPGMPLLSTPLGVQRLEPINPGQLEVQAGGDLQKLERLLSTERARRIDLRKLAKGRQVFAQNCIVCHSSIQPENGSELLYGTGESRERTAYDNTFRNLEDRRRRAREAWAREGEFWDHDPGQWLRDSEYLNWAESVVELETFWNRNYLSTDYRIPVNVVNTNSARAMATNAMQGHIWADFSSDSYRHLKTIGEIEYFNPYKGPKGDFDRFRPRHRVATGVDPGGGGPGFYRVPSLVSIWATAPFLHNNSLGLYNNDPSVDGRLEAFDDAIRKMLNPERRLQRSSYNGATPERLAQDHGLIWRTTEDSHLTLNARRVPYFARQLPFISSLDEYIPWLTAVRPLWLPSAALLLAALLLLSVPHQVVRLGIILTANSIRRLAYILMVISVAWGLINYLNAGRLSDLSLGPIPRGTPVNLIANINSEADPVVLKRAINTAISGFAEIQSRHLNEAESQRVMRETIAPALLEVSKCPDFVMDRGHYFEWFRSMSEDDKDALIELLKTF